MNNELNSKFDSPEYNFDKLEESLDKLESSLSKTAKNVPLTKEEEKKINAGISKLLNEVTKLEPKVPNRYKEAWDKVYSKMPVWKQREIDGFIKNNDKDNRFYEDFIQQVTLLAESDDPLRG
jgi:hypothetical protein